MVPPRILPVSAVAVTLFFSGCGPDAFLRYDAAVMAVEDGRNEAGLYDAKQAARNLQGDNRLRAEYVAGVAAAVLGQTEQARAYLRRASHSKEADVAGRAYMQLGTLDMNDKIFRQAANNYNAAIRLVREPLRSRASSLEADALERLGESGFTIQFGSFSSRANANTRAADVALSVRTNGLGAVRVRSINGTWKVQAGTFTDRRAAGAAFRALNRTDAVVLSLVE
jgi:tetratricopeptide (TPR) repeat protein